MSIKSLYFVSNYLLDGQDLNALWLTSRSFMRFFLLHQDTKCKQDHFARIPLYQHL